MKVSVTFKFDGIEPDSMEAIYILQQVNESCEAMRIGFDASECWVSEAVSDDEGE
jgi:hypothetical protein